MASDRSEHDSRDQENIVCPRSSSGYWCCAVAPHNDVTISPNKRPIDV